MTAYQERLSSLVEELGITGASFAYWDGETLHTAVAGLRNSVTGDPVTTDTIMHIGSITKIINATLVMQLVDDGLVSLDDPVVRHIPEFRLKEPGAAEKITVRQLLNHTSGIWGEMLTDRGPDQERIVDLIHRCADLPQFHPVGEGPAYCNIATVVAGYLVEKVRGESWYVLAKQRVFDALGLKHAMADPAYLPLFRQSVGDLTDYATGKLVQTTRPFLPLSHAPCGTTVMMSAADLVAFARIHTNGGVGLNGERILSEASVEAMATRTVQVVSPSAWAWGVGWLIQPGGLLWHGGGGPGVASFLHVHKPSGRVLALLTNCDKGGALSAAFLAPILDEWTGIAPIVPEPVAAPADLSPYEGVFWNGMIEQTFAARDGVLTMQAATVAPLYDNGVLPAPEVPLVPIGPDRFSTPSAFGRPGAEFLFVGDGPEGRRTGLFSMLRYFERRPS